MSVTEEQDRLGQVQSLVRAFSILEALRNAEDGLTLTEVAGIARLPRSTTHRLLATMNALRYVEFDSSNNRWLIGLQAFALGASFMQTRDLGRLGRPIMRSLMIDAGETVNIGIGSTDGLSYIAQVRPMHDQCASVPTGALMPLHTTASGKVLLAFGREDGFQSYLASHQQLERMTDASMAAPEVLADEMDRVRRQGFAVDDQEHQLGLVCVAAPIFDRTGAVRLSLSISGNTYRLSRKRLTGLGQVLASAADRMSSEIGGLLAA